MTAEIAALTRYRKKGDPGEALREAKLLTGLGMEGDFHQGGERQLCLLASEVRRWMDSQTEKGLCFGRFKENILITGALELSPGARLRAGEAVLRLSKSRKGCHSECVLFSRGIGCRLSGRAVFAVVERGGNIRVGDDISPL